MTVSLFRQKRWRNKIRLIAIESTGVTSRDAAPVRFGSADRAHRHTTATRTKMALPKV